MVRFESRRVFVTGGTSGMRLAGAKRVVSEGGMVIVTGLNQGRIADVQAVLGDEDKSS